MTDYPTHSAVVRDERGMALIATLLMLLLMSGLAVALTTSGRVEVAMGDNEELYAGARAAAESGLNRAAAQILTLTSNPFFPLNDLLEGPDGFIDPGNPSAPTNADNGLMAHLPQMGGADANGRWLVTPGSDYSYTVRLYDDDDPLMSRDGTGFTAAELIAMGPPPDDPPEDGTGVNDVNRRIVIRAWGFGPRATTVIVEQMLNPIKMPALLVDCNPFGPTPCLLLDGHASIEGSQGSVHTNGDLEIGGSSVRIARNATATGTLEPDPLPEPVVTRLESGGMPEIPVFDILASNYIGEADFVLRANGDITLPGSNVPICSAGNSGNDCRQYVPLDSQLPDDYPTYADDFGWTFSDSGPSGATWTLLEGNVVSATFYAEGSNVSIGGSGSDPLYLSVIAEGNITVGGTPNLLPEPNSALMFVTNKDLEIAGDLTQLLNVEGRVLVREQIHFTGNASLVGQVIVQNEPHTPGTPVDENVVEGNFTLTYNGLIETVAYTVSGWRETP